MNNIGTEDKLQDVEEGMKATMVYQLRLAKLSSKIIPTLTGAYISNAQKLALTNNVPLKKYTNGRFCQRCGTIFVPGQTCELIEDKKSTKSDKENGSPTNLDKENLINKKSKGLNFRVVDGGASKSKRLVNLTYQCSICDSKSFVKAYISKEVTDEKKIDNLQPIDDHQSFKLKKNVMNWEILSSNEIKMNSSKNSTLTPNNTMAINNSSKVNSSKLEESPAASNVVVNIEKKIDPKQVLNNNTLLLNLGDDETVTFKAKSNDKNTLMTTTNLLLKTNPKQRIQNAQPKQQTKIEVTSSSLAIRSKSTFLDKFSDKKGNKSKKNKTDPLKFISNFKATKEQESKNNGFSLNSFLNKINEK